MHVPLDTTSDAAEVQRRAYAAMDGFDRLRVAAGMRVRVLRLLMLKYSEPEAILSHLFRHTIPATELRDVLARMKARKRSAGSPAAR
jgi:hypothetical protein